MYSISSFEKMSQGAAVDLYLALYFFRRSTVAWASMFKGVPPSWRMLSHHLLKPGDNRS